MKTKKLLTLVLTVLFLVGLMPAEPLTAYASQQEGYWRYNIVDGNAEITGYDNDDADITVPSTLGGYPVTKIADNTFNGYSFIESISIPSGVTSIGDSAFYGCIELKSVTLPDTLTSIGSYAFLNCLSLKSITLPDSLKSIGIRAFSQCSSLESITIPSGVTSIEGVFSYCTSLESITIPSGVTSIEGVFSYCTSLKSIKLPDTLTSIGDSAFYHCSSLESITLPSGVTSIGVMAFSQCSSLESITIPSGVTSIGDSAFDGCIELKSVTLPDTLKSIGDNAFCDCYSLTDVNYGGSCVDWMSISIGNIGNLDLWGATMHPAKNEHMYSDDSDLSCNVCPASITPYTITFVANGGTVSPATATTNRENKIANMPTPTNPGYKFKGWYDAQTGGNEVVADAVFNADVTLYAQWEERGTGDFTVTGGTYGIDYIFENNALTFLKSGDYSVTGTTTTSGIKVASGISGVVNLTLDSVNISNAGLNLASATNIKLVGTNTLKLDAEHAVYANQTPLTIDGDGVLNIDGAIYGICANDGATLTVNGGTININAVKNGNDFCYGIASYKTIITGGNVNILSEDVGIFAFDETEINGDAIVVINAPAPMQFTKNITKGILIENNIGTMHGDVTLPRDTEIPAGATLTINEGQTLTIDDGVTLTNGGTIENNGTVTNNGTIENKGTIINKGPALNGTISGNDIVNIYNITLNYNDGATANTSQYTNNDNKLTSLPTPTRNGYNFMGWKLQDGTDVTVDTVYTADTEIIAQWQQQSSGGGVSRYTVKFDTDGGSTIKNASVTRNSKVTEPTAPTKEGYVFDGWYTDKDLTEKYDFESKVKKSFTLYAKWNIDEEQTQPVDPDVDTDPTEWQNPFTDVNENDWYYENVKYANKNGLMNGVSETTFAPNLELTRGMFVTILYRLDGEPAVNRSKPFADVNADDYFANAVIWGQQNGIISGVSETEFAPNANITREQMATILYRYAQYKEYDVSVGESTNILSYDDAFGVSDYAYPALQWTCGAGLIKGRTQTTLNPQDNATRAETAAILQRFIESYVK